MFSHIVEPPWSKRKLRQLGEALVEDRPPAPGCPTYDEVLEWHNELCTHVMAVIVDQDWECCDYSMFDATARPKTLDTLVQKLIREPGISLDQVQDLAGVRVDIDCTIDTQTALAREIVGFFDADPEMAIRDIRMKPHSGYRAVHVWLRLPAGRVEVQIRTQAQSVWANAYERLGDVAGRGVRYGEEHEEKWVRDIVFALHQMSEDLANLETLQQRTTDIRRSLEGQGLDETVRKLRLSDMQSTPEKVELLRRFDSARALLDETEPRVEEARQRFIDQLNHVKRVLDAV